jgi:hypothetical protein
MRRPDTHAPTKTGGLNDPVAQSIRAEQNADAAPSPEEAKREHRRWMADKGCQVCGEDDPDNLRTVQYETIHVCPHDQAPPEPFDTTVFCDEHVRSTAEFERAHLVQQGRNGPNDFLILYDCGNVGSARRPDPDPDDFPGPHTPRPAPADGPLTCPSRGRCDAVIDEVIPVDTPD